MAPNILFLFPDQWRWDWLGCATSPYGRVPVDTPNIDRLAASGVRFDGCRTNSPVCSPARACLALGLRYHQTGTLSNRDYTSRERPTFFRCLRDHGYHTATCGKSDLFKPDSTDNPTGFLPLMDEYGFSDGIDHRGKGDAIHRARNGVIEPYTLMLKERGLLPTHLDDHPKNALARPSRPSPLPEDAHTDAIAGQNALRLLQRAPQDKPWFLWVNFPGPHDPFDPPPSALDRYQGVDAFPPAVNPTDNPPAHRNVAEDRRHYAGSCSHIDDWVGRLLSEIDRRGERDNTIVVFASDHGEMLGDHGRWTKSTWHEGSIRVPLLLSGPGIVSGATHEEPVELIDIAATLLELAGAQGPDDLDAKSLVPVLQQPDHPHREHAVSQLGNWRCLTSNQWKLVLETDHPPRLFNLQDDPAEVHNLATQHPQRVSELTEILNRQNPPAPKPKTPSP